eukprot:1534564-Rhodomonas_salina.1
MERRGTESSAGAHHAVRERNEGQRSEGREKRQRRERAETEKKKRMQASARGHLGVGAADEAHHAVA